MAQSIKCLLSMHKVLSLIPSTYMVCVPVVSAFEKWRQECWELTGIPAIYGELEANLGYMKLFLKTIILGFNISLTFT